MSMCNRNYHQVGHHIRERASERANVAIMKLLDDNYVDQIETKKETLESAILDKSAGILSLVPYKEDFIYNNDTDKVISLLTPEGSVSYEQLLTLHVPIVHYEEECTSWCQQQRKCLRIRETVNLVKMIIERLEIIYPIFKGITYAVVGSLKEMTRIFDVDEVDITLSLPRHFASFLIFDADNQSVKFSSNSEPDENTLPYKKENDELDVHKYFSDFLHGLYKIVSEMEVDQTWKDNFNMDPLKASFIPCLQCMNTDLTEPESRRCKHNPGWDHDDKCGCRVFTSPSLTRSKIGGVLHLQWSEADGSKYNVDCDLSCPTITTSTPYDGNITAAYDYLIENPHVGWLKEVKKLKDEDMSAASGNTESSVRLRLINKTTVLARQVRGYNSM